nr:MAG TPA: hypothetical protein [Caudoviricetes sp.]
MNRAADGSAFVCKGEHSILRAHWSAHRDSVTSTHCCHHISFCLIQDMRFHAEVIPQFQPSYQHVVVG